LAISSAFAIVTNNIKYRAWNPIIEKLQHCDIKVWAKDGALLKYKNKSRRGG